MALSRDELLSRLEQAAHRSQELEQQLAQQAARADTPEYQQLSKELSSLKEAARAWRSWQRLEADTRDAEQMVRAQADADMHELAKEEVIALQRQQAILLEEFQAQFEDDEASSSSPVIIEIRAATGGLEASLFVGDLYRMYAKYAARVGLSVETMDSHPTEAGGFKEIIVAVKGPGAWQKFQFESGVHRVQRVPQTEAQGRIHTSTVTVAVMPEPEDVELPPIPAKDLQIDVYRSSGPGGQSVNTTDSAVRITHLPTKLVVQCQDERSQMRNKEKAMRVLRARLVDQMKINQHEQMASTRRAQVGTGERSEKIRTYNFPDRRVTDHRIGLTLHKFDAILDGNLQELIDALQAGQQEQQTRESKTPALKAKKELPEKATTKSKRPKR